MRKILYLFGVIILIFAFSLTACEEELKTPDSNDDNENEIDTIEEEEPDLFDKIINILNSQEEQPVLLELSIDLGTMTNTESSWYVILNAVNTAEKDVILDLSACTMTKTFFYPNHAVTTGKNKIIEIILPDAADSIYGGAGTMASDFAFNHFNNLEYISGANIKEIGYSAFYERKKLKEVSFPEVEIIDSNAFSGCESLKKTHFPSAEIAGGSAFFGCSKLEEAIFPKLKIININAFSNCANLSNVDFPEVKNIAFRAFENCANLTDINFPLVELLGEYAFNGCSKLKTINFPNIKIIYKFSFSYCSSLEKIEDENFLSAVHIADHAFYGCTSLEEINFPKVTIIEPESFGNCTSLITARFYADPERTTAPDHPLDPWRNGIPGICTSDSVLVHAMAFNGCASLKTLDFRNAWNVYFAGHSLANIGTHLDIYLFDDDGTKSYGHPQIDWFLGSNEGTRTITSLKLILTQIEREEDSQVKKYNDSAPGMHGIWVQLGDGNQYGFHVTTTIERE
ncbi:MAG: leucine-rich repeat domain-containing protein [Treponema sp.]|nr:leucine-rich repeat domain-containing protein [Treponema sp.]